MIVSFSLGGLKYLQGIMQLFISPLLHVYHGSYPLDRLADGAALI